MWFKHARLYRLVSDDKISAEALAEALAQYPTRQLSGHEAKHLGWTPPAGRSSDMLVHAIQGQYLLSLLRQERMLPSSIIKEEVEERAAEKEVQAGRPLSRNEKQVLKEQVYEEFLPRAFVRRQRVDLWWDARNGLIVVNAASAKRAEEALDLLRMTLGSLKVVPLATHTPPARCMTAWLQDPGQRPEWLSVGDSAQLGEPGDTGRVTAKNVDLDTEDMQQLLEGGRQASQLRVTVNEQVSVTLTDDLVLKSLQFSDAVLDEASQTDYDDNPVLRLETDFILMAQALANVISLLVEGLGGEAVPEFKSMDAAPTAEDDGPDPLYSQAAELVFETGRASISAIQRHFKIGYNRAARLIEYMEGQGVISPIGNEGVRKVLQGGPV